MERPAHQAPAPIERQVRGIAKMVDDDRCCIDILQRMSASKAAIDKVAIGLLDDHVRYRHRRASTRELTDELTDELTGAVS